MKRAILKARLHVLCRLTAACCLAVLCLCGTEPAPPPLPLIICDDPSSANTLPNSRRFGFFSDKLYSNYSQNLDTFTVMFGTKPAYILWFQQIDDPFPLAVVSSNAGRNIGTVISLNLFSLQYDSLRNDTLLREIAHGAWDSTLAVFARKAKQAIVPVYLRFGYEMNGYWFFWGEKPAEFVLAWNHAHGVFTNEKADNVKWIFAPGVLWGGMKAEADIMPFYPGDSMVDIIGLDGYNFGDDPSTGHQWQSFTDIFGASLISVRNLGKPLWITEIGCATESRRPGWLGGLFAFMDNNPCVETMLWFNMHKSGEPDFRLEADSASLAAMKNWLAK
jgi:hypothetical protein